MNTGDTDFAIAGYSCQRCGSVAMAESAPECCGERMNAVGDEGITEPALPTLLPKVFGVSQTGVDVCVYLLQNGAATTDEIAGALGKNRTTVTRQLNGLHDLGVVEREDRSLDEGGQVHVYSPVPIDEFRQRHREGLVRWAAEALALLDDVDERKLEAASEGDAIADATAPTASSE